MVEKLYYQDRKSGINSFDFQPSKLKTLLAIAPMVSFDRSDLIKVTNVCQIKSYAPQKYRIAISIGSAI